MSQAPARGDSRPAWIRLLPNAKLAEQRRQGKTRRRIALARRIGIGGMEIGEHGEWPVGDAGRPVVHEGVPASVGDGTAFRNPAQQGLSQTRTRAAAAGTL